MVYLFDLIYSLINFFKPSDYLFTNEVVKGNEQRGIFRRSFIGIRIEGITDDNIKKLDQYYTKLKQLDNEGKIEYGLILYPLTNWYKKLKGLPIKGNCSYFTGLGLKEIGIINSTSSYPLFLWFKVLYSQKDNNFNNVNIIGYQGINYDKEPKGALIYPFYWLSNGYNVFWNLDYNFANLIIKPIKINNEWYASYIRRPHIKNQWNKIKDKMNHLFY
jgi:hypothetical protein